MTVETATHIDDLNDTYPAGADVKSEGDDHLRLLKTVLLASFSGSSWPRALSTWADKNSAAVAKTGVDSVVAADDGKLFTGDATTAPFQLTIPDPTGVSGMVVFFKKIDAGANAVTIAPSSGTIDGAAAQALSSQHAFIGLWSDGVAWRIIAQTGGAGGGVSDHGALTGLADDDHSQYHNDTRGDARYYTQSEIGTFLTGKEDAGTASTEVGTHETTYDHDGYDTHIADTVNPHSVTAAQAGAADTAQGALADSALQPGDIASGTITARADDIDFSGGSDGDVLTVQADGSLAPEPPSAGSGEVNVTGDQGGGQSILADTSKTGVALYFKTFAVDTGFTLDDTDDLITIAFDATASPQFAGLNLGNASDTTLTRSAAGVLAVEGNDVAMIGGSQAVFGVRSDVITSVSGSLTTAAHSGAILVTSGNVTIPNAAGDVGFNAVIIAGGAHTVTFNSTTSAAMAAGDVMTIAVQSTSVIKAVLTAAADMVAFS